jgi:hypothetical protein
LFVDNKKNKIYPRKCLEVDPENNIIRTDGETIIYKNLLIAAGFELNYDAIKGLRDALNEKNYVSTNYDFNFCDYTFKFLNELKSGNAIFTQPFGPIKCKLINNQRVT